MVASTNINELIRIGESLTLEYKSSFDRKSIETLVAFANANGRTVVAIRISEYPIKQIDTRGKYFKRIASSNHQLSLNEITDLYMQSLQLSWDAYEAPREDLDSLSVSKIEQFIDQVNQCDRFTLDKSPLLALEKLKYVVNNRPTLAVVSW